MAATRIQLIRAHVTLGRDDELADLDAIVRRLTARPPAPLTLRFGVPTPFTFAAISVIAQAPGQPWQVRDRLPPRPLG